MQTPADKIAKRLSVAEWFARGELSERVRQHLERTQLARPPADRIAHRA